MGNKILKIDTDGNKGVLPKAEFGYDDHTAGGDAGRVYIGDGTNNIPLSKKAEVDSVVDGTTDVAYDNTVSSLTATNIKGALDEVASDISNINGDINSITDNVNDIINDVPFTEVFTASGGETVITIPNSRTYTVGKDELVVAIEGNVQYLGTDYTETDATTITLTTAMTEDEKILIQKV